MFVKFNSQYKNSKAWVNAYKAAPQAACSTANEKSLCSASNADRVNKEAMLMSAMSPPVYSSLEPRWTGGRQLLGPAGDQGHCLTCVSFSVIAAAEVGFLGGGAIGMRGRMARHSMTPPCV